jgi:hypothetical protein
VLATTHSTDVRSHCYIAPIAKEPKPSPVLPFGLNYAKEYLKILWKPCGVGGKHVGKQKKEKFKKLIIDGPYSVEILTPLCFFNF